jgi:hypothetical protein
VNDFQKGYIKSTVHRVVAPPEDQATIDRLGLLYFVRPGDDTPIVPADSPLLRRIGWLSEDDVKAEKAPRGYGVFSTVSLLCLALGQRTEREENDWADWTRARVTNAHNKKTLFRQKDVGQTFELWVASFIFLEVSSHGLTN